MCLPCKMTKNRRYVMIICMYIYIDAESNLLGYTGVTCIHIHIYIYNDTYICMYVCMYVCIYIYTFIIEQKTYRIC